MKKTFGLIILILITAVLANSVMADGGMIFRPSDVDMWRMLSEEQQYCAINFKDGYQRMILTVDASPEASAESMAWFFPVPANPELAKIDILQDFPYLNGYDVVEKADDSMNGVFMGILATQMYPAPFMLVFMRAGSMFMAGTKLIDTAAGQVTVYESIEKMGLTTELVSTKSADALSAYLSQKDVVLPPQFMDVLDEYIGKDYSFVISWVSDMFEFRNTQLNRGVYGPYPSYYRLGYERPGILGVFISFPTDKIYYPLRPTSVYGEGVVPAVIYVLGHVQPELYDEIEKDTEIRYFSEKSYQPDTKLKEFFSGYDLNQIKELDYTKVKINTASKHFVQDLWMKNEAPAKTLFYKSMINHTFKWGLLIFIIISCLSSLIAGAIVFRGERPELVKFTIFGLFNFLTIIGFWVASYLMAVERNFTDKKEAVFQSVNLTTRQRLWLAVPLCFIIISLILLPLSIILDLARLYMPIFMSFMFLYLITPIMVIILLVSWGHFKHKKGLNFNLVSGVLFLILSLLFWLLFSMLIH
ncbi:hypothetical protein JXB28_05935 [Candidatus Woesearchaeota archaeon]|nr:hypothetical protein [Candidatus Woesearchaeota archaeon]